MNILIENQILSPISVFQIYNQSESIIIERHDNYIKRTYRNRFIILSQNGPLTISIPLKKGKNNNMPFPEVLISYDKSWITPLKNTIKTCYGSAPFFDFFYEDLISIFEQKHKYIFDLNNNLRTYIFSILEIEAKIHFSELFEKIPSKIDYIDYRDKFTPKTTNTTIKAIKYPQVFEDKIGFQANVSVLDLLFNTGKEASLLL